MRALLLPDIYITPESEKRKTMMINPELLALAEWRLKQLEQGAELEKQAFTPPGGGGPPGGDPSGGAGGGPPPGAAPPMDPSMGGGAPPMDPSMAGGAPPGGPVPGGGGLTADSIAQIVTQTMQQQGAAGGAGGPGAAGKMAKPDINTVAIDIFQVKKMLQYLFNTMGIQMPPDILDGPNRDPSTGVPMPPGAPGSTSDPAATAAAAQQQGQPGGGAGGAPPGGAGGAPGGAIPPISPIQAGGPGVGGEKMSMDRSLYMGNRSQEGSESIITAVNRATALSAIVHRLQKR